MYLEITLKQSGEKITLISLESTITKLLLQKKKEKLD